MKLKQLIDKIILGWFKGIKLYKCDDINGYHIAKRLQLIFMLDD